MPVAEQDFAAPQRYQIELQALEDVEIGLRSRRLASELRPGHCPVVGEPLKPLEDRRQQRVSHRTVRQEPDVATQLPRRHELHGVDLFEDQTARFALARSEKSGL